MKKFFISFLFFSVFIFSSHAFENFDVAFASAKKSKKAGKYDLAVKDFTKALTMTRQLKNLSLTRFELANCYYKKKQYKEAAEFYKAVRATPKVMEYLAYRAHVEEGLCYYFEKKYATAIKILVITASYKKTHSPSHTFNSKLFLGKCYYFQKKYTEAEECFKRILAHDKLGDYRQAQVLMHLGLCCYFQKKYVEAQRYFKEVNNSKAGYKYFGARASKYLKNCENRIK